MGFPFRQVCTCGPTCLCVDCPVSIYSSNYFFWNYVNLIFDSSSCWGRSMARIFDKANSNPPFFVLMWNDYDLHASQCHLHINIEPPFIEDGQLDPSIFILPVVITAITLTVYLTIFFFFFRGFICFCGFFFVCMTFIKKGDSIPYGTLTTAVPYPT